MASMKEYRRNLMSVALAKIDARPGACATKEDQDKLLQELIDRHQLMTDKKDEGLLTVPKYRGLLGSIVNQYAAQNKVKGTHINRMFQIGSSALSQNGLKVMGYEQEESLDDMGGVGDSGGEEADEAEDNRSEEEFKPGGKKGKGHQKAVLKLSKTGSTHPSKMTGTDSGQRQDLEASKGRAPHQESSTGIPEARASAVVTSGSVIGSKRKNADADTKDRKKPKLMEVENVIDITDGGSDSTTPAEVHVGEDSKVKAVSASPLTGDVRGKQRVAGKALASSSLTQGSTSSAKEHTPNVLGPSPGSAPAPEGSTSHKAANAKGKRKATEPIEERQPKKQRDETHVELSPTGREEQESTTSPAGHAHPEAEPFAPTPKVQSANGVKRPSDDNVDDRPSKKRQTGHPIIEGASTPGGELAPAAISPDAGVAADGQASSSQVAGSVSDKPGIKERQWRYPHKLLEDALPILPGTEIDKCISSLTLAANNLAIHMFLKNTGGGNDQANGVPDFIESPTPRLERIYKQLFGEDWRKTSNVLRELGMMSNKSAVQGLAVAAVMDMVFEQPVPWDGPKEVLQSLSYYSDSFDLSLREHNTQADVSFRQIVWEAMRGSIQRAKPGDGLIQPHADRLAEDFMRAMHPQFLLLGVRKELYIHQNVDEYWKYTRLQASKMFFAALKLHAQMRGSVDYYTWQLPTYGANVDYLWMDDEDGIQKDEDGKMISTQVMFSVSPLIMGQKTKEGDKFLLSKAVVNARPKEKM